MKIPTSDEIGKISTIATKNPMGFIVAVFMLMFAVTYYLNIDKNDKSEEYWKAQYEAERKKSDDLKNMLLQKAGIIDYQKEVINYQGEAIKEADSTLRNSTQMQIMQKLKIK